MRDIWYVVAGGTLVAGTMLAYFIPSWLYLPQTDRWVLRGGLAILVLIAVGALVWFLRRRAAAAPAAGSTQAASDQGSDEVDVLIREAEARLQASGLGRNARLSNLPVILLVGEPGSTKTSTMVHSGLEPELLAGQVYQETAVAPTRSANLWFARQAVFVEAGGKLLADPARWARLLRRLSPGRLAVARRSEQAPRAVVVCFDCENFLRPGGAEAVAATARNLQARLGEIAQSLGISLPVYVLFTKTDRVPFFAEFVRNLSNEEAGQVFGATLPIQTRAGAGVYAEQETQRLTAAFNGLFHSLSDRRLDLLPRENDPEKVPGAYEFPREFSKLRRVAVQFLVDLCRPSQLRTNPFLRGFYFSGVRAILVTEMAPAPAAPRPAERPSFDAQSGATGMFRAGVLRPAPSAPQPAPAHVGTRKAPQWVFLSHLFHHVILQDRVALGASGTSVRANLWRRVLWASAAALCLLLSLAFIISYFGNRALEARALDAARGIAATPAAAGELASLDALARLETLRQSVETLAHYEREGPPLRLRWGLYVGSDIYPVVRRVYFSRFHPLLFGSAQTGLLTHLQRLPVAPEPNAQYNLTYDALKAYLITTTHHEKSTRAFLSPLLFSQWLAGRDAGPERAGLARKQFDFYSDELKLANPFSSEGDAVAVERARRYLAQFGAKERVYRLMLAEASAKNPPVSYNRAFPGFSEVVTNHREVEGAFTKAGWATIQEAMKHVDRYFGGEEWVLGQQAVSNLDVVRLEQELRELYRNDYIKQWRDFLNATAVVRYKDLKDAAQKLGILAGNQAPLLALFWLVSQHTSVAPELSAAFQPPQFVVPPGSQGTYIQPSNQNYMGALMNLQTAVEVAASTPAGAGDAAAAQTLAKATEAKGVTRLFAQNFRPDPEGRVDRKVQTLMEDPITYLEALLRGMGPAELRGKAQALCGQFKQLMSRYPFNPKATVQATLDDVNRFFRPGDGALWKFHSENLQNLIVKEGPQYIAKSGGAMTVTPAFLGFFNRTAAFSEAVYKGGQQPKLAYTLRSNLAGQNQVISLAIDGQTLNNSAGRTAAQQFTWPGAGPGGVRLTVRFGGEPFQWPRYDGLWAAFDFFADAEEKAQLSSAVYGLEWTLRTGQSGRPVTTAGGQPVSVRFDLDMMGAPPIFRKGYFSGLNCIADVAR